MTDVEQRLQKLEDRLAIMELEARYASSFDGRDGLAWSSLFTEDGIYQSRAAGGAHPNTFARGRAELQRFCDDAPFIGIHLLHLPQLEFEGDRAVARTHFEFRGDWFADDDRPRLDMVGHYDVAYVRVRGEWLISRRVTTAFARTRITTLGYAPGSGLDEPVPGV